MSTFQDLAAENPHIRQHVTAIGAPDPGEAEPDDFVGEDFRAAHPARYGVSSG